MLTLYYCHCHTFVIISPLTDNTRQQSWAEAVRREIPDEASRQNLLSWIHVLRQLPHVGDSAAAAVAKSYTSCAELLAAYRPLAAAQGERLLENLTYGAQKRRVGPAASKRIYNFFTAQNMDEDVNDE
jgi:NAD-dependent DNA ligase